MGTFPSRLSKEENTMPRLSKKTRIQLARRAQRKGAWNYEDQEFTKSDWQYDVANGDTKLGYFDWVLHNLGA